MMRAMLYEAAHHAVTFGKMILAQGLGDADRRTARDEKSDFESPTKRWVMFLLELIAIAPSLVVGAWLKRDEYDTEQRTRDYIEATDNADEEWLRLHPTQKRKRGCSFVSLRPNGRQGFLIRRATTENAARN
jgi:hypothetical protein